MKRQFRFTKRALDALPPCPENSKAKEIEYSDLEVAGLKVLCNRIGRKSFLFRYIFDGRKRSMKVGGYPETEITDARMKVIEWRAQLAKGIDPQESIMQAEKSRLTFQRFFDEYLWQHWKSTKRSAKADRSRWENHVLPLFGAKLLTQVTTFDLQSFHNRKKEELSPATANRIMETIKRAFNLAITWGLLRPEQNTPHPVKLHRQDNQRQRYLTRDELVRFISALKQDSSRGAADAFLFLLATGTRRNEALTARWEHIDMESRLWYLPKAKTGARHVVLNDLALEVLKNRPRRAGSPFVFPSHRPGLPMGNPTRAWQRVLERAGIGNDSQGNPFRIHDLRHTHISYIVQLGGSLYEASKLAGHSDQKMTTRYAHLANSRLVAVSNQVSNFIKEAQEAAQATS